MLEGYENKPEVSTGNIAPTTTYTRPRQFSVEDRIGAILSKDPAKRKEAIAKFDGHSLRCHAFFPDELAERG